MSLSGHVGNSRRNSGSGGLHAAGTGRCVQAAAALVLAARPCVRLRQGLAESSRHESGILKRGQDPPFEAALFGLVPTPAPPRHHSQQSRAEEQQAGWFRHGRRQIDPENAGIEEVARRRHAMIEAREVGETRRVRTRGTDEGVRTEAIRCPREAVPVRIEAAGLAGAAGIGVGVIGIANSHDEPVESAPIKVVGEFVEGQIPRIDIPAGQKVGGSTTSIVWNRYAVDLDRQRSS